MRQKLDPLGERVLFASTLWIALLTAILCAVVPQGLPFSQSVGSAFSPSTTVVALKSRAEHLRGAAKAVEKADDEPATVPLLLADHHVLVLAYGNGSLLVRSQHRPSWRPGTTLWIPASTVPSPHYPRGPPVA